MNKLIACYILALLVSCSNSVQGPSSKTEKPSEYAQIKQFYSTHKSGNFDKFQRIIVINEEGTCINCNNSFSKAMGRHIKKEEILFILSGNGTKVDMSAYVEQNQKNIILDFNNDFGKLNIVKQCAIIDIDSNHEISKTIVTTGNLETVIAL